VIANPVSASADAFDAPFSDFDQLSALGGSMSSREAFRAPGGDSTPGFATNAWRPLPPPTWVLPEESPDPVLPGVPDPSLAGVTPVGIGGVTSMPDAGPARPWSTGNGWASPSDDEDDHDDGGGLSSAGAFGGGAGEGRRFGLRTFDPGRRGVRALALVAVLVVVIAGFFAWRARPRVDPVAPPAFDATSPADPGSANPGSAEAGSANNGGGNAAALPAASGPAAAQVVVAVGGKVRKPGLVTLPPGSRVADALTAAGGPDPGVDVAMLNLARKVVDGELILVGVTPSPGVNTGPAAPAAGGTAPAAGAPVNLNTATPADLDTLPGVGPVLAQRILDARDAQGGFKAVSDLRKVDGIGDARYEQLKDLVTV
jgi:competence protein ComEA